MRQRKVLHLRFTVGVRLPHAVPLGKTFPFGSEISKPGVRSHFPFTVNRPVVWSSGGREFKPER
jgi:hypothetical protein